MYALDILECNSFDHARALRRMLEGDGFPAIAVTVTVGDSGPRHLCVSAAPPTYPERLSPIAAAYAVIGDKGFAAIAESAACGWPNPLAVPKERRNTIRIALATSVRYAADSVVQLETASDTSPVPTATADRDPGDEDTKSNVVNPKGGGWDCGDQMHGPIPHTNDELRKDGRIPPTSDWTAAY